MVTIIDEHQKTIKVSFPDEKYKKILLGLGINTSEDLSSQQYEKILMASIYEFKNGNLNLDELGSVGDLIFALVDKDEDIAWKGYAAGECIYYIRHPSKQLLSFLQELDMFYAQNGDKLSKYVSHFKKQIA